MASVQIACQSRSFYRLDHKGKRYLHVEKNGVETTTVVFTLVFPFNRSLELVRQLSNIWGLTITKSGQKSRNATVTIPSKTFERIFGIKPRRGHLDVPEGMHYFITAIEIAGVK